MTISERYQGILDYFSQNQPNPETELHHRDPFELLVAVMLSAQCTDKRVNMVTPALFEAYPTAHAMARASVDDILQYVKSVSYPNSKAAHLQAMAKMLVDEFHGQVPDNMKDLTSLPGVGRKTANVVMGAAFGKATIPVDTHVYRVSHRLGLSKGKTPKRRGKRPRAPHSRSIAFQGPSLDIAAWPVRVQGVTPRLPKLPDQAILQGIFALDYSIWATKCPKVHIFPISRDNELNFMKTCLSKQSRYPKV